MKRQIALLGMAVLVGVPAAVRGDDTIALQDTVYRLPEILIEAERVTELEELRGRPAFLAIVPMDDVSRRVSSAADYLAQTVGCHVRSTGSYGAYSTASVRGSSAKQVRVFLDGIPLNQSQSGVIDLADLPISSLSRIEVYRGFGPYDLSGSNIGGVINLVTKKVDERGSGHLSASYGSLSTQRYQASYSLSRSGWDVLTIGSVLSSEGDFEFLDDNGTPYNKDDDETVERINNEVTEYEALLKLSRRFGGGTLIASNQFYHRRQGLPGYSAVQSKTERMTKIYDLTHIGWRRRRSLRLPVELRAGLYWLYQLDRFEDRRPKTAGAKPDETNRTSSVGGNLAWKLPLPPYRQYLRGMVAVGQETFQPEETLTETTTGEMQTRTTLAVTLEDEVSLLSGRLRLIPSGRYERYADRMQPFEKVRADLASYYRGLVDTTLTRAQFSGAVGIVVSPGRGVTLKANYGRHYRVPSLMEIFGYRGIVLPSPDLEPEVGVNLDLGVCWEGGLSDGGFVSVECAYFWSEVDELIMFMHVPYAQTAQAINIDSAEIEGCEVSLSCGKWQGFTLSGNITHLRAINTGPMPYTNGRYLPNRPGLEASANLNWHRGDVSLLYEFDYISGNYWNAYNEIAPNNKGPLFDVRRLHNVAVTVPSGVPRLSLTLEVRNIADQRFEDVMGYPLPGRSVYGTVVLDL